MDATTQRRMPAHQIYENTKRDAAQKEYGKSKVETQKLNYQQGIRGDWSNKEMQDTAVSRVLIREGYTSSNERSLPDGKCRGTLLVESAE